MMVKRKRHGKNEKVYSFIVLTIVMLFSLTACGSADKSTQNSATDAQRNKKMMIPNRK